MIYDLLFHSLLGEKEGGFVYFFVCKGTTNK